MDSQLVLESWPRCMDCGKLQGENRLLQAHLRSWKDIYELNGTMKQSLPSLKVCGECLVGHVIPVLRQSTASWEFGTVHCYDECTEKHQFVFMDEDKEWIRVEGDSFSAYAREYAQTAKPRSHHDGHHHHATAVVTTKRAASPQLHQLQLASPYAMDSTALDDDDLTVAISHRKDDENEDYQSAASVSPFKSFVARRPSFSPSKLQTPRAAAPKKKPIGTPSPDRSQDSSMTRSTLTSLSSPPPSGGDGGLGSPSSFGSPSRTQRLWTPEEDERLLATVSAYPHSKNPPWPKIAESIPGRTGKQCRERFKDHLDPSLRQAEWSQTEDATIFRLYSAEGSKWSRMTKLLPGRTDNNIKNRYHHLRKRFEKRVQSIGNSAELDRLVRRIAACRPFAGTAADPLILRDLAFRTLVASKRRQVARYSMTDGDYKFGPFREVADSERLQCRRCGLLLPSAETSRYVCARTGWCQACSAMTPVVSGDALRIIHTMKTKPPPDGPRR